MRKLLASMIMSAMLLFIVMNVANAEEAPKQPDVPQFEGLYWMQMPVICGSYVKVNQYVESKNYILVYAAVGRVGGKEDGEPAFLIQEYITEDMSRVIAVVTSPNMSESCIMYSGFDVQFKKGSKGTAL